jgi:capsular polysaccharide biosynthesis protein
MTFRQQLRAVRASRVLVGFHGAALAHMAFLHPRASVLEISSTKLWKRVNYAHIAYNTNMTFSMLLVDHNYREEFAIPVDKLLESLGDHI